MGSGPVRTFGAIPPTASRRVPPVHGASGGYAVRSPSIDSNVVRQGIKKRVHNQKIMDSSKHGDRLLSQLVGQYHRLHRA